ncbi:C-type lectin domain family 4 member M-like isoform X2 [Oncorhynchus masou masou]|uniref:C-type lectin domain family 4 member M-like isoform X2 n=1 Tax=Oncorhynchus masou masou TaxID=90313 RepID=UPI003183A384
MHRLRLEVKVTVFDHKCVKMSEGVYKNSDGFEDDEPDAMKNTDIDDQIYTNVRAFMSSPRDGVVVSVHFQWWKRPSGVAAVCLGLLCVLLLAGIIGLSVYYGVIGDHDSTEKDQLQTRYNNLTKERDQLQTSYNNLTKERDQLQKEKDDVMSKSSNLKQTCPEGWHKFESSWYFLFTKAKTWEESRQECLERGADLVIINSEKEQKFLFNLNSSFWIGLTDSVTVGTWKWVDGNPLTTTRLTVITTSVCWRF